MQKLFVFLLLAFSLQGFSQYHYQDYTWGDPIDFPTVDSSVQKVIMLKKKLIEYAFEDGKFIQVDMNHTIEYVNSSEAVELSNKKYLPFSNSSIIMDPMARVIKPDGTIINLDESKILESTDEETGAHYKYFAFEGLEPGCIVEYMYVLKTSPRYNGKQEYVQGKYPVQKYEFDLYSPESIWFTFKTYNSEQEFTRDTSTTDQNHWFISYDSVPDLKDEFQAPMDNLFTQFAYKLDSHSGEKDATAYGKASSNIYEMLADLSDKKDAKAIKKMLKISGVLDIEGKEDQIYALEYYLKKNIRTLDASAPELLKPSFILKNKLTSERGMTKLYFHMLKEMGIKTEVVLTCDRTRYPFDPDFEAYHFLTDYLIYFPHSKKYIAPAEFAYRYGLVPSEFTDTYGLFIKEKTLGQFTTGIGKVEYIEPNGYKDTYSNLDIDITISDEMEDVQLDVVSSAAGYYSVYIQPYLELLNADKKDELVEGEIKRLISEADIDTYVVKNDEGTAFGKKPFVLEYTLTNTGLIENAGNKYLLKIGDVIGPQFELYSETERTLPVYSDHKRLYSRSIQLTIPEGYQIANMEDLEIHETFGSDSSAPLLLFESNAKLENNTLTISVEEYYDQLLFSVDEYESYRKIINSASDFNKIVLVLEPKG